MKKLQLCLVVCAILALTFSAFAQVQNGQFTGTVTDPTGASIGNAKVTVTNTATNFSSTATTNSSGNYTVKEVPPGSYKIAVEAAGFKTVENNGVTANAGTIAHLDVKLQLGKASEVVEVTGAASAVNTEDSKLATIVSSAQIENLPLNGRNVFDLMQMSTGAVNVAGVDFENGHGTVVNGVREDFNGFLINGVSNKGLSGGAINVPIQDSVEEFQQLQLNMSAQYGNSAGGSVNLVTKSGTNAWHGSAWEYIRNDALDANNFFLNQTVPITKKPPLRFNQFGLTLGGPVIKDKLFFFLSLQGDRFKSSGTPQSVLQESPAFRDAVIQANANAGLNSTAALLYSNFVPSLSGTPTGLTANTYTGGDFTPYLCGGAGTPLQEQKWASIFGVTPAESAICGIPQQAGTLNRDASIQESSTAIFKTQTGGLGNANLFNGNEGSLRLDYNWNANNRFYIQYNYNRQTDKYGPCNAACTRGFSNPTRNNFPQSSLSFVHTFSPSVLNELRLGYLQNNTIVTTKNGGVPAIGFADGSAGFGSYNGYPQAFKENIYTYSDMVSIGHGNHNMKIGVDFRRNIENSEFNVARPSYYFYDQVFFAADAPYLQVAGVDPGICKAPCPASSFNPTPIATLNSNIRHWRNLEMGAYFQDDWKASKRLTLNLGLRYDLYSRHNEEGDVATTFIKGPGANMLGWVGNANVLNGTVGTIDGVTYDCSTPSAILLSQLAGVCGPGGFAPAKTLGKGNHHNFGPRVGFAWDIFGNGKTALRGGFGVAYEGTLYNPLSNSRWNLPYYSFNQVIGGVGVSGADVVYGPSTCTGLPPTGTCQQVSNVPVTFSGCGTNPGNQGPCSQSQNQGNINGWDPSNPNQATLTGIIFPEGIRDPYVYNFYLSLQHQISTKMVMQLDYVGTAGHKLFRAEDINRQTGSYLPVGSVVTDNFGRSWPGLGGRLNQNYGRLRNWQNQVNSNYSSLQASLKKQMSHGLLFNVSYTYSHSIDDGSTWHSGATTANGAAAGEGFTTDQTLPGLDRGNSVFDIRHRLTLNYVFQLPGQNLRGVLGAIAGGWSYNGIFSIQSGAHWEPYTSATPKLRELTIVDPLNNPDGFCTAADVPNNCANSRGDYNLDGGRNDRPDSSVPSVSGVSHASWANGWGEVAQGGGVYTTSSPNITFSPPCLGCTSNLGRNTFVGPGNWISDMTLSKTFKFTERVSMKFDANGFNVFNHTNFVLATAGGGAHNQPRTANFGQAAGTLNERQLQFGVKVSF